MSTAKGETALPVAPPATTTTHTLIQRNFIHQLSGTVCWKRCFCEAVGRLIEEKEDTVICFQSITVGCKYTGIFEANARFKTERDNQLTQNMRSLLMLIYRVV